MKTSPPNPTHPTQEDKKLVAKLQEAKNIKHTLRKSSNKIKTALK
jgi:hypothetical protein